MKSDCCGAEIEYIVQNYAASEPECSKCQERCSSSEPSSNASQLEWPTGEEIEEASRMYTKRDEHHAPFVKGVNWLREKDGGEMSDDNQEHPETTKERLKRLEFESGWNEPMKYPKEHPVRWIVSYTGNTQGLADFYEPRGRALWNAGNYILQLETQNRELLERLERLENRVDQILPEWAK